MHSFIPSWACRLGLLSAFSILTVSAQAQTTPTWTAVQRFSASAGEYAIGNKVVVAADGSRFVSGAFSGTLDLGSTVLTADVGQAGVFLAKFNANGSLAWARQGVGNMDEETSRAVVAIDAAGNSYLAGTFYETVRFGTTILTTTTGESDAYVVKYDPQGNILWSKIGGGLAGDAVCRSAATDAAGNLYLSGHFAGFLGFGSPGVSSVSSFSDVFLCKMTPAGTIVWMQRAGSNNDDYVGGMVADAAGNTYLTGTTSITSTFGSIGLNSVGEEDQFVAKYDTQGNAVWARLSGGLAYDEGEAIAVDADGSVAVSGTADYTFSMAETRSSIYVARYTAQGALVWERKITPSEPEFYRGYGLTFDKRGGLYMTGNFQGSATFGTTTLQANTGAEELFAVRYDGQGNAVWANRAGAAPTAVGNSIGFDVTTDATGNRVFFTGAVIGDVAFGPVATSGPEVGFFLATLNPDGAITSTRPALADVKLSAYPNPASGQASLVLPVGGGRLVLTDALGRTVREQVLPTVAGICPVALSGLTPGVYHLRATLGNGQTASTRLTVL